MARHRRSRGFKGLGALGDISWGSFILGAAAVWAIGAWMRKRSDAPAAPALPDASTPPAGSGSIPAELVALDCGMMAAGHSTEQIKAAFDAYGAGTASKGQLCIVRTYWSSFPR